MPFLTTFLTVSFIANVFALSRFYQLQENINEVDHLQLSAIVNDDDPPYSAKIECWELYMPFRKYPTTGTAFELAEISNLTYVALEPRSAEGLHNPPHPMLFILLAGTAHVTLPDDPSSEGLWIVEGLNPIVVAVDTLGIGHNTSYPGKTTTVALQAPFRNGIVPKHRVLGQGACLARVSAQDDLSEHNT